LPPRLADATAKLLAAVAGDETLRMNGRIGQYEATGNS
jgi:hypothetical protein